MDRPYAAKIQLMLKDEEDLGIEFVGLAGSLYRENLIYREPKELRKLPHGLELRVIFRDRGACKNWLINDTVQRYWLSKFNQYLVHEPITVEEVDFFIEADQVVHCECQQSDFYILQGRSFRFCSELVCGSCLRNVSYTRIPKSIELEDWQTHYQRFYHNWIDSSLFEEEALRELTNYTEGKLNREGRRIQQQLSEYLEAPVYMDYFVENPSDTTCCVLCGSEGTDSGLIKPSKICTDCNVIFGY